MATQLEKHGIASEIIHIGTKPIAGCMNCGKCAETGYCVFKDDGVNAAIDKLKRTGWWWVRRCTTLRPTARSALFLTG